MSEQPPMDAPGVRALPPAEVAELLERSDTVLLDIRTPEEVAQAGLPGARNLDIYAPDFAARVADLDRDASYVMVCRSGARTGQAQALFVELGFRDVVDLDGGLVAWVNAGLPLTR